MKSGWNKKLPKPRKGAWYVKVRGSYLPCSLNGWLMHLLLLLAVVGVFVQALGDGRSLSTVFTTTALELFGLGAIFTIIARKKS